MIEKEIIKFQKAKIFTSIEFFDIIFFWDK